MSTDKRKHADDQEENVDSPGGERLPTEQHAGRLITDSVDSFHKAGTAILEHAPEQEEDRYPEIAREDNLRRDTRGDRHARVTPQPAAPQLSPDQRRVWETVKGKYDALLRLQNEPPENVFGADRYAASFTPIAALKNGEVTMCVCCMDERVPGPKLGIAGSGVLLTTVPSRDEIAEWRDEDIYDYLADPMQSGDDKFWSLVESLRERMDTGWTMDVSEHAGCGAVGIFCDLFEKATGRKLDKKRVATAVAARLHSALGLEGEHKKADYEGGEIAMNGEPAIHDAYCLVVDATGRVNLDTLGVRGLQLSTTTLVSGEDADAYLQTEVGAGLGIIAGHHGVGLQDAPVLLIGDPDGESADALERRLGALLDGRTVIKIMAPQAA